MRRDFRLLELVCTTCGMKMQVDPFPGGLMYCRCGTFPAITLTYDDHDLPSPELDRLMKRGPDVQ